MKPIVMLSPNFSLQEFTASQSALRRGISNEPSVEALQCLKELVNNLLQPLRERIGKPFTITSGYRSPELNKAVGGSKTSQHNKGQAVDFVVKGLTPFEVCQIIATSGLDFDQLIYEGTWIHVSYSKGKNRRQLLTAVFKDGQPTTYIQGLINKP